MSNVDLGFLKKKSPIEPRNCFHSGAHLLFGQWNTYSLEFYRQLYKPHPPSPLPHLWPKHSHLFTFLPPRATSKNKTIPADVMIGGRGSRRGCPVQSRLSRLSRLASAPDFTSLLMFLKLQHLDSWILNVNLPSLPTFEHQIAGAVWAGDGARQF